MPDFPAFIADQNDAASSPNGHNTPIPVITARRDAILSSDASTTRQLHYGRFMRRTTAEGVHASLKLLDFADVIERTELASMAQASIRPASHGKKVPSPIRRSAFAAKTAP